MARNSAPRFVIISVIAVILIVNAVLFGGRLFSWPSDVSGPFLASVSGRIAWLRARISVASDQGNLISRIAQLEEENGRLQGEAAQLEEIRRVSDFYREAANIQSRPQGSLMKAGIFTYNSVGGVRQAVINRGSDDGVAVGHIIMTVRGELLGTVQSVFNNHSVVWCIQDRSFQVTARVRDSDVTGLIRSDGNGSLLLDLVQKNELIAERALVVTSGDDSYPAGLVVGTVRSVDNNAATLFQIVHIDPAVSAVVRGPVLIIRP